MAICTLPALMADCAADSLLVRALAMPELPMQPAAKRLPITFAVLELSAVTLIVREAECVSEPALPVTFSVSTAGVTNGARATVTVEVAELPAGGVTELELKDAETPLGGVGTLKLTAELNPDSEFTVTVEGAVPPTLTVIGETAVREKSGEETAIGPDVPVTEADVVSVAVIV